ncbi:MAG: RNA polymerase factor sigma-32 [Deltaproteobacteria bacterium]|nr:RNA polymerase factor sigma-32 [Deltaproteobacteria bacterium]
MPAKRPSKAPEQEETAAAGEQLAKKPRATRRPKAQPKAPAPDAARTAAEEDDREERDDDDSPTEVVAEIVPEVVGDEEAADEDVEAAGDDDEQPRRKVVGYADDPEAAKEAALSRFDPMQAYLREVQRHPLLTPDEELSLATKYFETGDLRAAHKLVTSNLRLVVKIAYEYRRAYKNIMDLVQEGNVGLMQAVKKYDPTRGVKLSSYAAWWIRAYILRYILNNWRMVKLGTTQAQRKLFFNLNKEKQKLLAMGIDPSPKVIAERLNVDEKEVVDMDVRLGASEASLDAPVGDTDGKLTPRVDLMPGSSEGADILLAEAELNSMLKDKLATFRETLKGKDLEIFDLRLVAQDEPLTLQELGDKFGVSRERVRQLEARLVGKLRQHLRDELEEAARS